MRHPPVCGYRRYRQSLVAGAGCFPWWSKGRRGFRLSSASPTLAMDLPSCPTVRQTPPNPGAVSLGSQYVPGMCVRLLPLLSYSLQPVINPPHNILKSKTVGRIPFIIINKNSSVFVNLGQCVRLRVHYKFIRITAWRKFYSLASAAFSHAADL